LGLALPKGQGFELFLNEAKDQERKYDWMGAIKPYVKALNAALEVSNNSKAAEIRERIGFCYRCAAMQAENPEEFKKRMLWAIKTYRKAAKLFGEVEEPAKTCHCKAMATYLNSWLAGDPFEKKKLLDECWKLEKKALKFYEEAGDRLSYGKTCNELLTCLFDRKNLAWDWSEEKMIFEEAVGYGEGAIASLSEVAEEYELARAYCLMSLHHFYALDIYELEKSQEIRQKCLSYAEKALNLSKKIGDAYLIGITNVWLGLAAKDITGELESSLEYFENALQHGIRIRDNYLIGWASRCLAYATVWKVYAEEDSDKKREVYMQCKKHSEHAIRHFSLISYDQEIAFSYLFFSRVYQEVIPLETSSEDKRALLKKSVEAGEKGLEHAQRSGSAMATYCLLHQLSKSLFYLSTMERDVDRKNQLLIKSLQCIEQGIKALDQELPYYYWNRGVFRNYLALIQAELAKIERNKGKKVKLLRDAIANAENSIELCLKRGTLSRYNYAALGRYYGELGGIVDQLYRLTGAYELSRKLIEAFKGVVEMYGKAGLMTYVAEGHWQLAKVHNRLCEYLEASGNYESASEEYRLAAEKMPQFKDFYLDYALYMQAWSEIEKAKLSHEKEDYGQSTEHYEKAADNLKSSRSWDYLSPNYSALAVLESAEYLSRKEKSHESMQAFQKAAKLFTEAMRSLEAKVKEIESPIERRRAIEMSEASDQRREYCIGRSVLEEAKIYSRKGDKLSSAEKYASAARVLERVAERLKEEKEREELESTVYLCRAWEKMELAEKKASPDLYGEAAELFTRAKKSSAREILAAGNACFCKALEAGTKFKLTRNLDFYSQAKQYMQSAAEYYIKAGLEHASTWTNATQVLFDAYVYAGNAETEVDLTKKLKLYQIAERCLQTSAQLYEKAGYSGMKSEVIKNLGKVREKRELAMSLSEVLRTPQAVSSTMGISAPVPVQEEAVGLEDFESANLQGLVLVSKEQISVDEELKVKLQFVNVGHQSGLLISVKDIIPEGFKLKEEPRIGRVEGRHLNMKGKQLGHMKALKVDLTLQPTKAGKFTFGPKINYVDEKGKLKLCEIEPVGLTVKTAGLREMLEYVLEAQKIIKREEG